MKLVILVAALMAQASSAPAPGMSDAERPAIALPPSTGADAMFDMPNAASQPRGCRTIRQQVQDEARRDRDGEFRTLDRDPPAHLMFAVDRQIDGCREVTFVRRSADPVVPSFGQQPR